MINSKSDPQGFARSGENVPGNAGVRVNSPHNVVLGYPDKAVDGLDIYFSADVETDGPIPGPFSMLSCALVYAGAYDGTTFYRPPSYDQAFYAEIKPISDQFEQEALNVNGLDRDLLSREGSDPETVMTEAAAWVRSIARLGAPVIVAYPLSFDWPWLYWYFVKYSATGSPFGYSRAFDIKTAIALKLGKSVSRSGREKLPEYLRSTAPHTHHARDDAVEQAEIFANIFALGGGNGKTVST